MPAVTTANNPGPTYEKDIPQLEVKVLVTGFGKWSRHSINPSDQIVSLLPPTLSLETRSGQGQVIIRLMTRTPLPVSYRYVHTHLPVILDEVNPDLVLHIGLADSRTWYGLELSSAREGYCARDIEGFRWDFDREQSTPSTPSTPSALIRHLRPPTPPRQMRTSLDYPRITSEWIHSCTAPQLSSSVDVRASDDVGTYLCGFSYYTTLSHFWMKANSAAPAAAKSIALDDDSDMRTQEQKEIQAKGGDIPLGGPALFLHVPACPTSADVDAGVQITVALIQAMATSWLDSRESEG